MRIKDVLVEVEHGALRLAHDADGKQSQLASSAHPGAGPQNEALMDLLGMVASLARLVEALAQAQAAALGDDDA